MKKLMVLPFLFLTGLVQAQKFYVWCPRDIEVKPRVQFLENDTLNVVLSDARMLTNRSKEKCETNDIASSLVETIQEAYPRAVINRLPDSLYYRGVAQGRITIKIGIAGYHAAFGSDLAIGIGNIGGSFSYGAIPKHMWNAVTAYTVSIYNRGSENKKTTDICKIDSHSNTGGFITAKNVLNRTYRDAVQQLLLFIDGALMP